MPLATYRPLELGFVKFSRSSSPGAFEVPMKVPLPMRPLAGVALGLNGTAKWPFFVPFHGASRFHFETFSSFCCRKNACLHENHPNKNCRTRRFWSPIAVVGAHVPWQNWGLDSISTALLPFWGHHWRVTHHLLQPRSCHGRISDLYHIKIPKKSCL